MSYAVLEQKLRMVNEQDFEFVSHFLDLVLSNRKNSSKENQKSMQNSDYLAMLDKSFSQLESGDVVVKSMDELRAMENS
jgi:hypothetical protein